MAFLDDLRKKLLQPRPQAFQFAQGAIKGIGDFVNQANQKTPSWKVQNPQPILPQQVAAPVRTFLGAAGSQIRNDVQTGVPALYRLANPALTTLQQRQQGQSELNIFKNQLTDLYQGARLGSYALGAPRLATKAGVIALGSSGLLGGGINKVMGGSFAEGAGKGVAITPQMLGITRFSNPLIEQGVGKFAPGIASKLGKVPGGGYLASSTVRGLGNIPEGAVIDAALGRRPLSAGSAALDFASGFLPGGQPGTRIARLKQKYPKMNKIDIETATRAIDRVVHSPSLEYATSDLKKQDERVIRELAGDYINKTFAKSKPIEEVAQELWNRTRVDLNQPEGMAFAGKNQVKVKVGTQAEAKANRIAANTQQSLSPEQRTTQQVLEAQQVAPSTNAGSKTPDVGGKQPPSVSGSRSSKYAYNINKTRLQLTNAQKKTLDEVVTRVKPELAQVKGAKLTNKQVINAARKSEVLTKVTTREETLQAEAAVLRARQRLTELDKGIDTALRSGNRKQVEAQMKDMIESLRVVSSNAADAGRKLQSLSINAGDESVRTQVLREIGKTNAKTDDVLKAAQEVDWNSGASITKFYRKFVKPSIGEILDEYRYNNMLSSPKTHIRNAFSNVTQTYAVRPMTLVFEGRPVEAAKYFGGAVKGLPDAYHEFIKAFKGDSLIEKPDLPQISTGKLPGVLTVPSRLLEAGDKFFTALIKNGEIARGKTAQEGEKTAEYYLFRQGLKPEHQGQVLNAIDSMTAWTYKAPKAVRWFVPFIRTPMNFAKQWVEYSPAGYSTLIGAGNKREQFAKATLGSTITLMGAMLAAQGRTTWAAPTDPKQKELFYASGKKPFSVRVGDRWVPMQYAGGLAMALAMPAAMKYYQEDSRTALSDSQLEKATKSVAAMAEYLSGQTFMEGIGNFVKFFSGDADYSLGSNLGYTAGQLIPMQGLVRYINTIVDPVYRKSGGFVESIQSGIPGLSQGLEAYTDPSGQQSVRDPLNYPLPYDTGKVNPQYEQALQARTSYLQNNALINKNKKEAEKSGKSSYGNVVYYSDPKTGESGSINLNKVFDLPESNKYEQAIKQSQTYSTANQIMNSPLTDSEKRQYLDQIGVDYNEAQYYQIASQNNNEKSLFVTKQLDQLVKGGATQQQFLQYLVNARKSVNGDRIAADGVIDNLVTDGYIDYNTGKQLKKIKPEVNDDIRSGKVKPKATGKKIKAVKPPAFKSPSATKIQLKKPKLAKINLGKTKLASSKTKVKVKGVEDFQAQLQAIERKVKNLS